jgi:TRAP-type uncharacterized transport system substrate-binding protein
MTRPGDKRSVEDEIQDLKASLEKHTRKEAQLPSDVVTDLTKAIHDLSDQVVSLHRRIEKIEESQPEWTTGGWLPPPGTDRPS